MRKGDENWQERAKEIFGVAWAFTTIEIIHELHFRRKLYKNSLRIRLLGSFQATF